MERSNAINISNGGLECLKWLALILMTGDHISTFLFGGDITFLNNAGRIALPIFAFVFAYNLGRDNAEEFYTRSSKRLLIFGIMSMPLYLSLANTHNLLPLNILFTLLAGLLIIISYNKKKYTEAVILFVFVGFTVEYNWFGLALIFTCHCFVKSGSDGWLYAMLTSLAMLYLLNVNFYAFLAVPIIMAISWREISFPRFKWAFYAYYPLHLAFILLIKVTLISPSL